MVATQKGYVPDQGDVVWVNFNPQKGREQKDKRPAIVVSPQIYNKKSSLVLVCPITSQEKGYPFEVIVRGKKVSGVVLVDQVRSIDWHARAVSFEEKISKEVLIEIQEKLCALIVG
jgi:mRNA interferase MazF